MIVAVVCISLLALALLVAHLHTLRSASVERQKLLDRIQSPEAVTLATLERVAGPGKGTEPAKDTYDEPVQPTEDAWLDELIGVD